MRNLVQSQNFANDKFSTPLQTLHVIMIPEKHKLQFPDHTPCRSKPGWGCRWGR